MIWWLGDIGVKISILQGLNVIGVRCDKLR
jgi:hypothetical protein